jgi:coatomer protein complex subunit alpha (xenin)
MTSGAFASVETEARSLLHATALVVVADAAEVAELRRLRAQALHYLTAARLETARRAATEPADSVRLAGLMTACELQQTHLALALRSAMTQAYKAQCYNHAATYARRLLAQGVSGAAAAKAEKLLSFCTANAGNASATEAELGFDPRLPTTVCPQTLAAVPPGTATTTVCPFCGAQAAASANGDMCASCGVARLGAEATGLQWVRSHA